MMVRSGMPTGDTGVAGVAARTGRMPLRTIACALLVLLEARSAVADDFSRGLALFYERRFEEAIPFLEKASARRRDDADVRAWLAETCRRLGRAEAADSAARAALALAPCHAFAHDVMADNFAPQFGWSGANADSAWAHALNAVECDSTEGSAWLSVWGEALRRNDRERERRVYRRLVGDGFLTPSVLAYARWLLAGLPERSLLLVNGDMDTYPTLALQETESLRPDVVVVNVSMLNMDWYRRMVRDRLGVPMPFAPEALDNIPDEFDSTGAWIEPSLKIQSGWRDMVRLGLLGRPLVYSTTIPMDENDERAGSRRVLAGAHYLILPWPADADVDTASVRASLRGLSPSDFAGAWVSERDRSPVRRAATHRLAGNVIMAAMEYAVASASDRPADALAMLDWADDFGRRARVPGDQRAEVKALRDRLKSGGRDR